MRSTMARLVLDVGGHDELDRVHRPRVGRSTLSGAKRRALRSMRRLATREDGLQRAEVLLEAQAGGRARRAAPGVMRGRPAEAAVELHEGGEAGAAEAVDRLVVVAHDHDVVRPVRRAAEQLDELDLGDVGVLELVHEEVAELRW